jgi:tetratricopeptide (TPR) repeat protein
LLQCNIIALDDALHEKGLMRSGRKEEFVQLSYGHLESFTQEKLYLLVSELGLNESEVFNIEIEKASGQEREEAIQLVSEYALMPDLDSDELPHPVVLAVLKEDLPLFVLAKFYCYLAKNCWANDELERALELSRRAAEIGEKAKSQVVSVQAAQNLAMIFAFAGELKQALDLFRFCLGKREFLESQSEEASALSNLGAIYQQLGDLQAAEQAFTACLEHFEALALPVNLSVTAYFLGWVYAENGQTEKAEKAFEQSRLWAEKGDYSRGGLDAQVGLAQIMAMNGQYEEAEELWQKSLFQLKRYGDPDLQVQEVGVRIARLAKNYELAAQRLKDLLESAKDHEAEFAAVCIEAALLAKENSDLKAYRDYLSKAASIYQGTAAEIRFKNVQSLLEKAG